ncbi:MAG: ABC transporter permease subunit [Isosphaeraceae bacterium]|nr:ABC transporter permease subunit [Isosphaeraceae bacterium]
MEEEPSPPRIAPRLAARSPLPPLAIALGLLAAAILGPLPHVSSADTLAKVRAAGKLVYGSDDEGGAPFIYLDKNPPHARVGFEVDLLAELGKHLGAEPEFHWGLWENLLQILDRGEVDLVVNGYELTPVRTRSFLATRPYYVYQLQLMAPVGGLVHSMAELNLPKPGGGRWRVGVLGNSVADNYAQKLDPALVSVVRFDGATNAMTSVRNGRLDATIQDLPAALFYVKQEPYAGSLFLAGPPEGCGYYVMYVRKGDEALRDAVDSAIDALVASGKHREICEKYGLWNPAQEVLSGWKSADPASTAATSDDTLDFSLIASFSEPLLWASLTTIALAFGSMPIAMLIGMVVALGREFGPRPLGRLFGAYVEVVRGTPLMLQLYLIFFMLPELGIKLNPWVSGITGLAINYSAYEAEIYRAGLQAVPVGQMEAALALGMTKWTALRRVIVPQAVRIVIPPVTSDFIALFKDTSVCSVVTLVELTRQYSILSNSTGAAIEFGLATAVIYLVMSLPLSWFSRWVERKLDDKGA